MDREAIDKVLDYCEVTTAHVQVTWDGNEYTADFKNDIHARTCSTELIESGIDVRYNPTIDGVNYYARLI